MKDNSSSKQELMQAKKGPQLEYVCQVQTFQMIPCVTAACHCGATINHCAWHTRQKRMGSNTVIYAQGHMVFIVYPLFIRLPTDWVPCVAAYLALGTAKGL